VWAEYRVAERRRQHTLLGCRASYRQMTKDRALAKKIRLFVLVAVGATAFASGNLLTVAHAQEPATPATVSDSKPVPNVTDQRINKPHASEARSSSTEHRWADEHPFWDKPNGWLFTGVAASRTLDFFSTLNMRRRGRQEILLSNDAVDNHAAFAAIEAAGTGVSIGASYLFHRSGHHKLERWVSIVHIGMATTGAVRNYCLQTFHGIPAQNVP
jgi:hypothetical protein